MPCTNYMTIAKDLTAKKYYLPKWKLRNRDSCHIAINNEQSRPIYRFECEQKEILLQHNKRMDAVGYEYTNLKDE